MKHSGYLIAILALSVFLAGSVILNITQQAIPEVPMVEIDLGGGRYVKAPATSAVEIKGKFNDTDIATIMKRFDEARGVGVGIKGPSGASNVLLSMDFGSPKTSIDGGASSMAGWANVGIKAMFDSGAITLYLVAGVSIILGCVLGFWLKAWKIGIGFIVGGVVLFMVVKFFTTYPWVLWILMLAAVAVVAFLVWDYWKKRREGQASDAIIAGIEGLPAEIKRRVTALISSEAIARGTSSVTKQIVTEHKTNGAIPRTGDTTNGIERLTT